MTVEHVCTDRCTGGPLTPEMVEAFPQSRAAARHRRSTSRPPVDSAWARRYETQLPPSFDVTMPSGPACYMALNEQGRALYVGSAANPTVRIGAHAARAKWYPQAVRWRIWPCDDRRAAYVLERRLIAFYQPAWNIA